ncbi:MAG: endonuclease/exonuclease/phosphatase family protein [Candidatus Pacebacteria bacterium]|nr:endonuclease/exonuclease/phosphatase family protein [Candidatus Paceibacterota bacterium]
MKIYSWNMLFRNRELDRAFDFIAKSDFDIFCLQEVPETFLTRLKTLPCHIASRIDVERLFVNGTIRNHVVILSRHPIETQSEIPFPEYWHLLPLRARFFVWLLRPFGFSKIRNRGGLYVDIATPAARVRVFNLHLILAQPAWRLTEFENAMLKRDPLRPTIVCGDFNILEKPHITLLNWMFGGRVSDVLLYNRERTRLTKRFVEHELVNALAGGITHPLSQSQLDHILVSHSFSLQKADILPDRIGSDHHPIRVEIE